ncbi:hypothetical protein EV196_107250 [Mariniflexile fucanivorans]|uniref:Lipoprotein n=1 Tax=Mariniflexile fucanivorans TaxID=264023 RepID=A0A4R1RF16_9FLAO|nr:hypothetical protein [Mariniflexile fucanivorans]TCL64538.1 hypothetical protein EV196_107250 [Mariniflexile fucanivorans]
MRFITLLLVSLFIFSCGKDKVLQLPEIKQSEISKINDISPAYLFYNETEADSVELNRKNLISSTNWLINVDKRLTLKQAIPHIKFLQEKKENSSHKNENSKNYFTCNNTSKTTLGFIEFTNTIYYKEPFNDFVSANSNLDFSNKMKIDFNTSKEIYAEFPLFDLSEVVLNTSNFEKHIKTVLANEAEPIEIILCFNQNLTFQDYISFKYMVLNLNLKNITISNNEFISN